jgi:flagellar motor switch protein FliG
MNESFSAAATDAESRIAILLHVLGDEVAQAALAQLTPERAVELRRRLDEVDPQSLLPEEVEETLQDFERSLRLASPGLQLGIFPESTNQDAATATLAVAEAESAKSSRGPTRPPAAYQPAAHGETTASVASGIAGDAAADGQDFQPTDDPFDDLNRLSGFRIASALKDENPRSVAIVLGCLESDKAAEVLGHLPDALRSQAFMALSRTTVTPSPLLQRIVRTTVTKAAAVQDKSDDQSDTDRRMAEMLRALPRKTRSHILENLDSENPELAARLKNLLYFFEDLLKVEDRSLQKLLMEVDVETLLTSLRGADERILEKVMRNVGKRVRETLTEEMQYMPPVPEEQIEAARLGIVKSMAELDQQGQLAMES